VIREFRKVYGLTVRWLEPGGRFIRGGTWSAAEDLPALARTREHALNESVRWGEAYSFFLVPGLISWMVPVVQGDRLVAGVTGTVLSDDEPETLLDVVQQLIVQGARPAVARDYVEKLPVWPQHRIQAAETDLFDLVYRITGWKPTLVMANRERAAQQRQIAEEIQRRKLAQDFRHPLDEERRLLSLIRVGDRKGARGCLNSLIGVMFLSSPNPVIIKARAIELLGYLVRAAVEDSPHLEPLIEKNHRWTSALILTRDFEDLTHVLGDALDHFMEHVYLLGSSSGNAPVRNVLTYIADHYRGPITLAQVAEVAGLSTFRTAHLLKETTGCTFLQHMHRLRVAAAQKLLEEGSMRGTEVGYAVGYNDQSYFILHFKRLTGTTPARYARRVRG
jgi:AraC-like DNA-binding protein